MVGCIDVGGVIISVCFEPKNMNSYSINDYVGQQVRRISFLVKKADDCKYHHLMSVVEYLFPDMQDYDVFRKQEGGEYIDFVKEEDGDKDKMFFVVDFPVLTESFLNNPTCNYSIGGDPILPWNNNGKEGQWKYKKPVIVPLHEDEKADSSLFFVMPSRRTPAYINIFSPSNPIELDVKLAKQLQKLSLKNLGKDFTLYPEFYGAVVVASYNPIYKSLDFTEDAKEPGVFVRVNYRTGCQQPLIFIIKAYTEEGVEIELEPFKTSEGAFLSHITIPHPFRYLSIEVFDSDIRRIDYYERVVFLHRIEMNMQVKSKEVHVKDDKGNTVNVIEKFAGEQFSIGNPKVEKSELKEAPEISYQKMEDSLTYIFFDGDKEKVDENKKRAAEYVMKILNTAQKRCYICDMYFSVETLKRFVMPIKLENVEIRILSSKEELKTDDVELLKKGCRALREKNIANVRCRLLRGEKAALHDRFIVADENVWFVGCSFDEIGVRASNIVRVPTEYRKKIIDRIYEWWNDDNQSEEIL